MCFHFQQMVNLEQAMLAQEISIPVYFSKYDTELNSIIEDISKIKSHDPVDDIADVKGKRDSALGEIINSISANGYQVSRNSPIKIERKSSEDTTITFCVGSCVWSSSFAQ